MKVGVVVITYNNENHIEDTIKSLQIQDLTDWICVWVDNGSTDHTFEIGKRFIANDVRFKALRKANEGPGPGRNFGFSNLPDDVEFVHFLDGDDILYKNYLSRMSYYLERHPEVGLVACQFDEIDNDGNFIGKGHRSRFAPSKWGIPRDIPTSIFPTPFVAFFASTAQGPFGLYRRSVYIQTGGYELESQEDTDMFCKMALLAEVHYLPDYLYVKRRTMSNLANDSKYRATHSKFRKKWDMYHSEDPKINKLIEKSLKYYYLKHKPLRDFKVSAKAFRIFIRDRNIHSFKWSMQCLWAGVSDLIFRKSYRHAMQNRKESFKRRR